MLQLGKWNAETIFSLHLSSSYSIKAGARDLLILPSTLQALTLSCQKSRLNNFFQDPLFLLQLPSVPDILLKYSEFVILVECHWAGKPKTENFT